MNFANLNNLWYDALFSVNLSGDKLDSRAGDSKEIIGYQSVLTHPLHNILFVPNRKFSLSYACAEMLWYLSGTASIGMIKAYAPQYEKFAEKGMAFGAYGSRWIRNPGFVNEKRKQAHIITHSGYGADTNFECFENQLYALIHLLKDKPNTRQAIITMWDSGDLIHAIMGDHKDLPCTLSLCFFVRNDKLHLIATMRSNDAWLGLPYDVFCFTTLQRIIAAELKLKVGKYIHQAGSEHIYARNQEKVDLILREDCPLYPHPVGWNITEHRFSLKENIERALVIEKELRISSSKGSFSKFRISSEVFGRTDPLFKDLVLGCATKWATIPNDWFDNPLFANWQKCEV
jgi:thymidylate synthase